MRIFRKHNPALWVDNMESNSAPYKLWLHHQNYSSSSLIARGMEVAIPPGRLPHRPSSHQYISKELPPLPTAVSPDRYWNASNRTWGTPIHREMTSTAHLASIDRTPQRDLTHTKRTPQRYPRDLPRTPTMTKSSHKILQLTGFDPRFEMTFPKEHQQINEPKPVSPATSKSSGSVYSQPGIDFDNQNGDNSRWSSGRSSPTQSPTDRGVLQSFYNLSEHMAGAIPSVTSLRYRSHPPEAHSRPQSARIPCANADQNQIATLRGLVAKERARYDVRTSQRFENDLESPYRHELTDVDVSNLVPRPLALRPKNKTRQLSLDIKPGLLRSARDSLEWGINEMAKPRTKHYNTPATPLFDEGNLLARKAPPPLKPRHKLFATGNHPLKSPFPFHKQSQDVPESGRTLSNQLSGAMKHLSGSCTSPKRSVISNHARKPDGPDTPMPKMTGFMSFLPSVETTVQKGGVHFQEAVMKAKGTVRFKTADERKRESLKKSITVVGISDQSPDGRIAEWL